MQKKKNSIDYMADSSFKEWTLYHKNSAYWQAYLQQFPEEAANIKQAREEILTLATPVQQSSSLRKVQNWAAIKQVIDYGSPSKPSAAELQHPWRFFSYKTVTLAAALLVLTAFSVYFFLYNRAANPEYITYQSEYGTTKWVVLPDSSTVQLVGKSALKTLSHWKNGQQREVWLSGNADFKVKHIHENGAPIQAYDRFIVHTPLQGEIEVLGTEFRVNSLLPLVNIHLRSGSIAIRQLGHALKLRPGQTAILEANKKPSIQDPAVSMDWKNKELQLNNAPYYQVALLYKDVFGRRLVAPQQLDTLQRLDGFIPFGNAEQARKALSTLLNIPMKDYPIVAVSNENK